MADTDPKSPILGASRSGRRVGRLSRRYSVNSLRSKFVSRLPDKLRSGIDPESDPFDLDLSKASGLSKGLCLCLSVCVCLVCQKIIQEMKWVHMIYTDKYIG